MLETKRKILSWWWKLRYKDYDILWFDDLVDMETGKLGIKLYHRVGSTSEGYRGIDLLGMEIMTRAEAESMEGSPCEECFKNVLPRSKKC